MGLEHNWRCDACGNTAAQGEAKGWHRVAVTQLEPTPLEPPVDGQAFVMPLPPPDAAIVCTKDGCLTKSAKEQAKAQ